MGQPNTTQADQFRACPNTAQPKSKGHAGPRPCQPDHGTGQARLGHGLADTAHFAPVNGANGFNFVDVKVLCNEHRE